LRFEIAYFHHLELGLAAIENKSHWDQSAPCVVAPAIFMKAKAVFVHKGLFFTMINKPYQDTQAVFITQKQAKVSKQTKVRLTFFTHTRSCIIKKF
jgi:uncharacterized membrane protein YobD (UPF0266 family)